MYSNFLKCFPFPLLLIASSIFPALLDKPPETNLPGCRTSPVDLAKPWEHLKPTCFAAARTSNMSLHTSGRVVAPKSGLFACHTASNADGEPRKNDTLNQYIDDAREQTDQRPG